MPSWLDRLLPTIGIEGETRLPEPEMEAALVPEPVGTGPEQELVSVD